MVVIDSFRGEHRFLSNFHPCPVEYEGLTYPNAEAAFHAQKCTDPADRMKYVQVKNPVRSKRMGRREQLPADWDARRYDAMKAVVRAKFANPEMAERLLATGDAYLVEGNHWHDNYWGRCSCEKCRDKEGGNRLGMILMDIRAELAS